MKVSFSLANLLEWIMEGDLRGQRGTEHVSFTMTGSGSFKAQPQGYH